MCIPLRQGSRFVRAPVAIANEHTEANTPQSSNLPLQFSAFLEYIRYYSPAGHLSRPLIVVSNVIGHRHWSGFQASVPPMLNIKKISIPTRGSIDIVRAHAIIFRKPPFTVCFSRRAVLLRRNGCDFYEPTLSSKAI